MTGNRKRRRAGLGYITIMLVILIVFAAAAVFVSRRFAPSKVQANLEDYYNLTAYESLNRPAAESDELAICFDDWILDNEDALMFRAVKSDGDVYVSFALAREYIDRRFYYDKNEDLVIFTDANGSSMVYKDSNTIITADGEQEVDYVPVKQIGDYICLSMKFIAQHADIVYQVQSSPARLFITDGTQTYNYCTANADIKIRSDSGKKASVVATAEKDEKLKVLSQSDGWLKVIDPSGYIGYVQSNFVSEVASETVSSGFSEPEYTHILMDEPINMVWHGIYYYESNQYIGEYTNEMTGVNVLAPTWFLFSDTEGNILSYANQDYVNYAHENGWKVWAVLEDMDGEPCTDIIPYTSKRQAAISQMISECLNYGIDGINVDLETVGSNQGDDFIQFIRELSAACRKNHLVLSCDDYAPYSYNAFRHTDEQSKICDYVAIMAYDNYVGGNEAGPNAGLPFVDEVLSLCEKTVDMDRLIVGLPFYTRTWMEYGDGSLGTDTVEMGQIENMVWEHGLTFDWMETIGYNYAEYEADGATVRIWAEDAKSLEAKLQLISEYPVAGISCWRLGQETSDVWEVLEKYY